MQEVCIPTVNANTRIGRDILKERQKYRREYLMYHLFLLGQFRKAK